MTKPFGRPSADQWGLPALLAALSLLLWCLPQWHDALVWSREGLAQHQWWRLWSGHLLHTNGHHLLMNLGGLAVIFALHQPHYRFLPMLLLCLLMMPLISLGIELWVPAINRYVGLSALLHGLFTWGALQDIRQGWRSGYLLLLGVVLKVGYENTQGGTETIAALIDARVAVESHLMGVLSALLLFVGARLLRRVTGD
ncbi:rhombosortase [Ferrimonas marina]|uniref:rhombosortase n=1 Tax=Ferrimonas marina TaxID=299255 RepID=UPI00082FDBEF|nr:rhombosortase [Ferrimonas marina]